MPTVSLQPIVVADIPRANRLLAAYQRELQEVSPTAHPPNQRYPYLGHYFTDPDRHPFFIIADEQIVGLVFVNRYKLLPGEGYALGELYVEPDQRLHGVGGQAAELSFQHFPGPWEVANSAENQAAVSFWRSVIKQLHADDYHETDSTPYWSGPIQTFTVIAAE